jgi:hypothetical protein
VSVAIKKIPAVSLVRVRLNDGLTIVDLKPGNTLTLAELRQVIKRNGFVSKEATAIARGRVAGDDTAFVVDGTGEELSLAAPANKTGDNWQLAIRAPERR